MRFAHPAKFRTGIPSFFFFFQVCLAFALICVHDAYLRSKEHVASCVGLYNIKYAYHSQTRPTSRWFVLSRAHKRRGGEWGEWFIVNIAHPWCMGEFAFMPGLSLSPSLTISIYCLFAMTMMMMASGFFEWAVGCWNLFRAKKKKNFKCCGKMYGICNSKKKKMLHQLATFSLWVCTK